MYSVELKQVDKSYDKEHLVVKNVSVTIEPGEFFVLVGPSGCGKSTLLRMIAGLEDITSGSILIDGKIADHLPPSKRELSMVFQNYALYPHMTVEDNITFGLDVKKILKKEKKQKCYEIAEMLGLTDYLKRKPRHLSGGQRQRVALARAIITNSPICLMDEPLSNLDAKLRAHMRSEIRELQRKLGLTLIYVTHDQVEAMTMGDRIMVLNEGMIQQVGKPIDVYNTPVNSFVAKFIGSPPMNLTTGLVDKSSAEITISEQISLPINRLVANNLNSDQVLVGIRPENIKLYEEPSSLDLSFEVTLDHVEILGTETLLKFKWNDNSVWYAKWYGQWDIRVGQTLRLTLDSDSLCIYDGHTEKLLQGPRNIQHQHVQEGIV
ncbi:carbohydrate ABC transporter ATP-binding protein, CUT1 family [Gracilibacillus orientalis]|uniref:Carbohydrate ABC transporter ATP-binding protein, CUT1 family n=1 Tax=Gracilibacillus orientalis TaxID=334253 RepID=A0A1I4MH04_9BACI|nr:ABC transporter ATP-binding protein [Gracilibacillus orientalis]SFM02326.1 carbohydrate ABC transporter ATP-binding protein, CUT1 family [Gracilibacillus orientalis]